jgi:hypothetical protein
MRFATTANFALWGIGAAILFQPVMAPAIIIRDDQPDSGYVNLGAQAEYAAVGAFVNDWSYNGSAILIAPNWILTAAHNLILATSGTFTINGNSYTATDLIRHPSWQNGNPFGGYDIGLARLTTPVTDVAPVKLYEGSAELEKMAVYVGYGITGNGLTGYQNLDNKKRGFQNIVDANYGNQQILLGSDFDNPHTPESDFGSPNPLLLEGMVSPGDSGGGVFVTMDAQTYLIGVISFVAGRDGNPNGDYGDVSGFGRVSALNPWIASIVPEPSTYALLVGGGLVLYFGRLRLPKRSLRQ